MKNLKNKKGFTIVELVIVIAVIAILAAVLIPTFSNVIQKAEASADLQEARNAYTEYLASDDFDANKYVKYVLLDSYYYTVNDWDAASATPSTGDWYLNVAEDGEITLARIPAATPDPNA